MRFFATQNSKLETDFDDQAKIFKIIDMLSDLAIENIFEKDKKKLYKI